MNDPSVVLSLPASFVLDRVQLTPAELVCGYRLGWVAPHAAVQLALAGLEIDQAPPAPYEDLALLLSDRHDQIPDLMEELGRAAEPKRRDLHVWIFLALCWIYEHRAEFADPFSIVEQLYADFDYPEEIEGFVPFLPVAEGLPTGVDALYGRWLEYLQATGLKYRHRSHPDAD